MKASDLNPLLVFRPTPGDKVDVDEIAANIAVCQMQLNDLLAILQDQEERLAALEAGHLRDRALESPEAIQYLVERARALMGQD